MTEHFTLTFGTNVVLVQLTLMNRCCHIWLGSPQSDCRMNNMVTAIQTKYDSMPLSRILIQSDEREDAGEEVNRDEWANTLSARFAKRLNMQVFVSCNLPATGEYSELLSSIELSIVKHIKEKVAGSV